MSSTGELVDQLTRDAAELAAAEAPASPVVAMEEVERLAAAVDHLEAVIAFRVQAADGVGQPQAQGFSSTTAWLRRACGMRGNRAGERVKLARQLARLRETARQFAAGKLRYGAVAAIAHAVRDLGDEDVSSAEQILLEVAEGAGADATAVAGRHLHAVLHPDGALSEADKQFGRRWFTVTDLMDGMGRVEGLVDPELKARLRAALDPSAKPAGADDTRTAPQRYADALDTLLRGAQQTHLSVIVDLESLTGGDQPGVLPDGSPLPAADARRIAFNGGISRVIVGPGSLPLDVGREQRLVTPAIRRALEVRDGGCVVDGCDIPARLCEVDHITPWALGGVTGLANTALCCSFHNKYKNRHPERVAVTRHPDGRVTFRISRRRPDHARPRDGPLAEAA